MDNCTRLSLIEGTRQIGENDLNNGLIILNRISERVRHAREKHPQFDPQGLGLLEAQAVVKAEMDEFVNACLNESVERQESEALDVIATCLRFLGREYEH